MRSFFLLTVAVSSVVAAQPVQLTDFAGQGAAGIGNASAPVGLVETGGVLYFSAAGPGEPRVMWQHDTATGLSRAVADGQAAFQPEAVVRGRVYGTAFSNGAWRVQEFDPETGQVQTVYTFVRGTSAFLTAVGDRLFFFERTSENVDSPHFLNVETGVATLLTDPNSVGGGTPTRVIDQTAYYFLRDRNAGSSRLWATEASGATGEVAPGYEVEYLPVEFGGTLYAGAVSGGGANGLVRKDLATGEVTFVGGFSNGALPFPFAASDRHLLLQYDGVAGDGGYTEIYTYTDEGGAALLVDPPEDLISFRGTDYLAVGSTVYLAASVANPATFQSSGYDPATIETETGAVSLLLPDETIDSDDDFLDGYLRVNGDIYFSAVPYRNSATGELFSIDDSPPTALELTVSEAIRVLDAATFSEAVRLLLREQITVADRVSLIEALLLRIRESVVVTDQTTLLEGLLIALREQVVVRDELSLTAPGVALATRFLSVDGLFDFGPDVALQIDASGLEGMGDVLALHVENGAGVLDDRWTLAADESLTLGSETTLRFQLGALDGPALSNPDGALVVHRPDSATPTPLATTYDAADDVLVAAWPGEGAFAILDGGPVSTEDGPPVAFGLDPPYPNPAIGRLMVQFDVPAPADVRLTVYDALGRRVARLAEGPQQAGTFTVGVETSAFAPGVYLVRMESDGFTAVRRFVVAR